MNEPVQPPQPAQRPVEAVLNEFLEEQKARLKPSTFRKYQDVIDLFMTSMNNYAYQTLDQAERAGFEQHYGKNAEEHREFCQFFGADKIAENVGEFLGYFMIRKVMCGAELKRAAGTVMKKLGQWLAEKGYVDGEEAEGLMDRGAEAARNLPQAERLAELLAEYASGVGRSSDEAIEDHFTIDAVMPGKLHLSPLVGDQKIVISVPLAISSACTVGWEIAGAVAKTKRGWRLLEVWNVYP